VASPLHLTVVPALVAWILLAPCGAGAEIDDRGWGYLIDKLVGDGLERERVLAVFEDPRMPPFTGLEFSIAPRESHALYRSLLAPASVQAARQCRDAHAARLAAAEETYGVPASLIAAILHVETRCGRSTGSSRILHRLARLAMANEPANVEANVRRLAATASPDEPIEARVRARAYYLESTFYPEVRAAFELARRMGVDLLEVRGSTSGAVGTPQFLPGSYLRYGADAGGDGRVDLFDPADAVASCANYLAGEGWRPDLSDAERRAVIWRYNHSDAYVDAVLTLARWIDEPPPRWVRASRPRARGGGRRRVARATSPQPRTRRSTAAPSAMR
jgi:membrane-bound lytic murein transglycosylase B